jgi:hypothetical protein
MKVTLRINVADLGKDGETVTVSAAQANWLLDQGFAVKADDVPQPTPSPSPVAPPVAAPAKKAGRAPRSKAAK